MKPGLFLIFTWPHGHMPGEWKGSGRTAFLPGHTWQVHIHPDGAREQKHLK